MRLLWSLAIELLKKLSKTRATRDATLNSGRVLNHSWPRRARQEKHDHGIRFCTTGSTFSKRVGDNVIAQDGRAFPGSRHLPRHSEGSLLNEFCHALEGRMGMCEFCIFVWRNSKVGGYHVQCCFSIVRRMPSN